MNIKRFGLLFLAAALGSMITVAVSTMIGGRTVRIEHVYERPVKNVSYPAAAPMDFTATSEKVLPAVVHIKSTTEGERRRQTPDAFRYFFDEPMREGPSQSSGSGVIINESGYIVTNNHVVAGADVVEVSLWDNRSMKAEVIGTDPDTDLAVIKIKETGLPFLSFVNSDLSKVGEWVLAVGNPFDLNSTVTAGIISAKGRNINIIQSGDRTTHQSTAIESFIQTDAAINPGNSGGALVDLSGGLIGINTAIASPTGAYSGYGFAVPSNLVSKVVEDLISSGMVQRGWLGLQIQDVTPRLVKEKNLSVSDGTYVGGFPEKSAAKEAGIKVGDVITKIDEVTIKSNTDLIAHIGQRRPGDKVKVTVNRDGKVLTFDAQLKNKEGNIAKVSREETGALSSLAMELEDIDPKTLHKLDIPSGVRVKSLGEGKIKRYTDMKEGFIITDIDNKPVKSVKEANEILNKKQSGAQVIIGGQYENFPREYLFALRM